MERDSKAWKMKQERHQEKERQYQLSPVYQKSTSLATDCGILLLQELALEGYEKMAQ